MAKKILVLGHPLVVDVNREVWSHLANKDEVSVDLIVPKKWKANLIANLEYQESESDKSFENVYPVNCFFKGNGSAFFFNPIALCKILRSKKYDKIILTQETWSIALLVLWIVKKMSKNFSTKIFLWVCQNIKKDRLYFLRHFERVINSDVQRILGCCSETMDVIDWKGIKVEKYYLPFSYDRNRFEFQEKDSDIIKIGYIGRISEEKGMDDLLEVVERFKGRNSVEFHVAGAGVLSESIENHPDIKFHGVLKHAEADAFYKKMNIILLPSKTRRFWKEQFGRVIAEGAASGCVVVGSNSGAIPEVMGIVGMSEFNFQESDVEDFVKKIEMAIKYIHEGKSLEAFSKNAAEKFSHEAVAELIHKYLLDEKEELGVILGTGRINGFV